MGNRQSKPNKKTKESPRRDKLTKKGFRRAKLAPSESLQRAVGASSRGHGDVEGTILLRVVIEPRKDPTIADTSRPQAAATAQASSLRLEPSEATSAINEVKSDDKIRKGTRKDLEPEAGIIAEPHPVPSDAAENDEKNKATLIGLEPETVRLETAQLPVAQSVGVAKQSEATTTHSAIDTLPDSNHKKQGVVCVEEKELLTVSDTHSAVAAAPESAGATCIVEVARSRKEKCKSATPETQLKHGLRAQDGSNQASSKKPAQRKRHKRTGRHGEQFTLYYSSIIRHFLVLQ